MVCFNIIFLLALFSLTLLVHADNHTKVEHPTKVEPPAKVGPPTAAAPVLGILLICLVITFIFLQYIMQCVLIVS
jgi:hypothetical protein